VRTSVSHIVTRASAEVGSGTRRIVGSGFGLGKRWAVLEVQDGRISEGISRGDGGKEEKDEDKDQPSVKQSRNWPHASGV
jgi:hypothetical protein